MTAFQCWAFIMKQRMDSDQNYSIFLRKHNRNIGNNWIISIGIHSDKYPDQYEQHWTDLKKLVLHNKQDQVLNLQLNTLKILLIADRVHQYLSIQISFAFTSIGVETDFASEYISNFKNSSKI